MRGFKERFEGRRMIRRALAAGACVAVSGGLVACGGSSGSGGGSTTNAAAFGPGAQLTASDRECLQKHGLDLRAGGPGGPPPNGAPPAGTTGTVVTPPKGGSGTTTTYGGPPPGAIIGPQGGSGASQMPENVRKAFQACGVQPPTFRAGGPPNVDNSAYRQSITSYVACVRQNGYELPDPNLSGNGPIFDESKVNRDDPKFQSASQKCQHLLQPPSTSQGSASSSQ
jgi:hypothetical protein